MKLIEILFLLHAAVTTLSVLSAVPVAAALVVVGMLVTDALQIDFHDYHHRGRRTGPVSGKSIP